MKDKVCIVVSSAMTVNTFLLEPIKKLSLHYHVHLLVNDTVDSISPSLEGVTILPVQIERKVAPFLDLFALLKLIKIFRKYQFKMVHSVTPKAGLLAMMASFFCRVPTRIHIFTGQVWVTRHGMSRFVFKLMDRVIAFLATDVLVDSASQRQFLVNERIVNTAKSSVLAKGSISGVDTERFKPNELIRDKFRQELFIDDHETVFLFIGRLNRDKGVLELATAFSKITDSQARLLIVGPDEDDMQSKMEKILAERMEQVNFVGFSSHPEKYMAAADVLCLPSYREGFGSVVIEAAAVGIPTIGSDIYGIKDAVEDSKSGLLFPVGNIDELLLKMRKIISNDDLRKNLGDYARKRALQDFSSKYVASQWLEYYRTKI